MIRPLFRLWQDEEGVASIEAALIVAVLAVGTVAAFIGLSERMNAGLSGVAGEVGATEKRVLMTDPGLR